MRVRLNKEKCIGCYACYVACIAWNHSPEEEDAQSHRAIRKIAGEDFQKEICVGCTHCGLCLSACPNGSIYREEEHNLVLVDQERCVGCRTCRDVCPNGVIHYDADGKMEKCDGCLERLRQGREPACVRVCCVGALSSEI